MALWQEILSTYGDSCVSLSFQELADEFGVSEASIGRAIAAIERRKAGCGRFIYADGSSKKVSLKPKKRIIKKNCGCRR